MSQSSFHVARRLRLLRADLPRSGSCLLWQRELRTLCAAARRAMPRECCNWSSKTPSLPPHWFPETRPKMIVSCSFHIRPPEKMSPTMRNFLVQKNLLIPIFREFYFRPILCQFYTRTSMYKGDLNARRATKCIFNGRWLERTETNLIHLTWGSVWIVTSIFLVGPEHENHVFLYNVRWCAPIMFSFIVNPLLIHFLFPSLSLNFLE